MPPSRFTTSGSGDQPPGDEERKVFGEWLDSHGSVMLRAIKPIARACWWSIPKGKFDRQMVDPDDLCQFAAYKLLRHKTLSKKLLAFHEACRLWGIFIERFGQHVTSKQQVRDRLGRKLGLEGPTDPEGS